MAREHGVADVVVDAIGRAEGPPFEADEERTAYMVVRQLSETGRVDQAAYDRHVDDIQEPLKLLIDGGAEEQRAVSDVGGAS